MRRVFILAILSCIMLAFMPVDADDYTLEIFGNANMDDTIDDDDIEYVKGIIDGSNAATELADANYDGEIDEDDIAQIELIISGEENELTVIDTSQTPVTIKKPLKRVVTTVYTLETLRPIKVPKDVIVGLGSAVNQMYFFPEYQDVPEIATGGKGSGLNLEEVLSLDPDVVIYRGSSIEAADRAVYEAAGIPALVFDPNRLTNFTQILKIEGYMFDKREEVEEYLDFHDGILGLIEGRVKDIPKDDKPKVYFGCRYSDGGMLYSTYPYSYSRIDVTGAIDIFEGIKGEVSPEAIIEQDPDIIICPMPGGVYQGQKCGYLLDRGDVAYLRDARDAIMGQELLQSVKAVKDGNVYVISAELLNFMPGCSARQFLQEVYFAKWFHPELFEDLDPQAIHQEYLTRFQGVDIDLDKEGVFVYHPELNPYGS